MMPTPTTLPAPLAFDSPQSSLHQSHPGIPSGTLDEIYCRENCVAVERSRVDLRRSEEDPKYNLCEDMCRYASGCDDKQTGRNEIPSLQKDREPTAADFAELSEMLVGITGPATKPNKIKETNKVPASLTDQLLKRASVSELQEMVSILSEERAKIIRCTSQLLRMFPKLISEELEQVAENDSTRSSPPSKRRKLDMNTSQTSSFRDNTLLSSCSKL